MGGAVLQEQLESNKVGKKLAAIITSIQWSYALFWSPSSIQSGELKWEEGYYNGDIKTTKTILTSDLNSDEMGFQRSDQLKQLYDFLISGDTTARRPSASLSPEDLTNAEWYYLLCMSFTFPIGQGLPGRSLANGQPIWLCNAHLADTRIFCRSLLAKSAEIKTVVCIPFYNGVIELGVTELVEEDLNLVNHIMNSFLEISNPVLFHIPNSFTQFDTQVSHMDLPPLMEDEGFGLVSPSTSSNRYDELIQTAKNKFLAELMDDHEELSYCVHTSMTCSDCVSETFVNRENVPPSPPKTMQEKIIQDPLSEDLHYQNVLLSLFKKSHSSNLGLFSNGLDKGSSFTSWNTGGKKVNELRPGISQKMLKQVLLEVPWMHNGHSSFDDQAKEDVCKEEADEPNRSHVLAERKRREKVNQRFSSLKSLIPSSTKVDKVSILDDAIAYLKELEGRVAEIESCQFSTAFERKNKRPQDMEEKTSDNYKYDVNVGSKKRKDFDFNEGAQECILLSAKESTIHNIVTVHTMEEDIFIDIKCPWRESLLLEIMDAMSNLHLDSHSIESSTIDGILSLTIKSRLRGSSSISVGMITQTLQKALSTC